MVKNTVQRDEKRVIIYYTFDDEAASRIQDSGFGIQQLGTRNPELVTEERSVNE